MSAKIVQHAHLAASFFEKAAMHPDKNLFYDKMDGQWQSTSYGQAAKNVRRLAASLIAIGLKPGAHVAICSENRSQWAICDLAIMACGGIVVPVYTTNTQKDHEYIIGHSQAQMIMCSAGPIEQSIKRVIIDKDQITDLIIIGPPTASDIRVKAACHDFDTLLAGTPPSPNDENLMAITGGEGVCCIIYTSGTGGKPKGVMLTHKSIQANIASARKLLEEGGVADESVFLSLLPLAHAYEHTAGLHLPINIGAEIWYCEGAEKISANLAEVKPILMTAVPRLYEVLYERITKGVRAKGGLSEKLFNRAIALGRRRYAGEHLSWFDTLFDKLLDRLVRAKIRNRLGGNLRYFVSGGAALHPDIGTFFLSLGVNILQGYGQTEASPLISANRPGRIKIETVGPAVEGVEAKLAEDGELLVRGDCLMKGYWQDQQATDKVIKNGWLHTGDLASIDEDDYISIIGRKKDMIVNSGGENISPAFIESEMIMEPEIAQIMVDGDRRPWLVGVIVPSDELMALAQEEQYKAVQKAVNRVNIRLAGFKKVRKFIIADDIFSIENNQMTPTMKVKRHIVGKCYRARLDGLYKK